MRRRHSLPRLWLMTDERQGDALLAAVPRLPRGAGIVFRHYSLAEAERRALFERVKAATRRRGLTLLLAGPAAQAYAWGADGSHGRGRGIGLRTASAHNLREIRAAERAGAAAIFLSPVYPTRSHPGATPLGAARFAVLARRTGLRVIALGGMGAARAARLRVAYGWAAIDAWSLMEKAEETERWP
jgi:thiamine-phosphate pyrophosphorylase